ncbi:MAG TPA: hypothetical protein VM939_12840, partial [Gemmatimonadaceae bacterium]|nr:hypothetical protein [Gemmatimonadaceae bacterium]
YESMMRYAARVNLEKPIGAMRVVSRTLVSGVAGTDSVPPQRLALLGGPTTGPGYEFHEFAGRAGGAQRLELRVPAPFPSFSLGRYGKTPASITLAPFVNAIWITKRTTVRGDARESPSSIREGWFPSVGIGALSVFDLLRFDVARGLRDGRWTFSVDVGRDFWGIL